MERSVLIIFLVVLAAAISTRSDGLDSCTFIVENSNEMPSLPPRCADHYQEGNAEGLTTFEEMVHTISTGDVSFTYPYLEIRKSLIPGAHFGVFTTKFIKEGVVVEVCPCINLNPAQYPEGEDINDYIFHGAADDSKRFVSLGFGSMYNHHDDPNMHWRILNTKHGDHIESFHVFVANRNIGPGEELYHNYGGNYWLNR